jgi:fructokinase
MIVVAGEALIDMTPATCGERQGYVPNPGGSSYNVAIALARLGCRVAFLGRISRDAFGRRLHDHLVDNAVGVGLTVRGDEPTPVAFVHLGAGEPEYTFHVQGTADRLLSTSDLTELPEEATLLHFGSISLVLEPGASSYEDLARRESGRRLLTLDPNVRPSLIPDLAAYRRRLGDWIARVDLVKVSEADLDWLAPGVARSEVAGQWLERGAAMVVVTRGEHGATAFGRGWTVTADPVAVDVADTVGAGDAFTAAVLAELDRRRVTTRTVLADLGPRDAESMLGFAVEVAARTCARTGADPPHAQELGLG